MNVSADALSCPEFQNGYCSKGRQCPLLHEWTFHPRKEKGRRGGPRDGPSDDPNAILRDLQEPVNYFFLEPGSMSDSNHSREESEDYMRFSQSSDDEVCDVKQSTKDKGFRESDAEEESFISLDEF